MRTLALGTVNYKLFLLLLLEDSWSEAISVFFRITDMGGGQSHIIKDINYILVYKSFKVLFFFFFFEVFSLSLNSWSTCLSPGTFFFLVGLGFELRAFMLAKWVLYCLSQTSSAF
jgi:hypothetical protein